jgi:hypothetical protein
VRTWVQNLYRWCAPVATGRRKRLVSVRRFSSQQLEAGADSQKGEGNPHYTRSHLRGPPMHSALPCMRVRKSRSSQTAQETASTCQRSTTLRPERTANKGARGEPSAGCFRSLSLPVRSAFDNSLQHGLGQSTQPECCGFINETPH